MGQRLYFGLSVSDILAPVCVALLLLAVVLPSMHSQANKLRRSDAIAALTHIELAQEKFHTQRGTYALTLAELDDTPSVSGEGFYALELQNATASGYTAVARLLNGRARGSDHDRCGTLTLTVVRGRGSLRGPSAHCWLR